MLNQKQIEEARARLGISTSNPTAPTASTLVSRLEKATETPVSRAAKSLKQSGEDIKATINDQSGTSPVTRGFEATAEAFNAPIKAGIAATPEPVREAVGKAGDIIGKGFQWLTDKYSDSPEMKLLAGYLNENPKVAQFVDEALKVGTASGEIAGNILMAEGGASAGKTAGAKAAKTVENIELPAVSKLIEKIPSSKVASEELMQRVGRIKPSAQQEFRMMSGGETPGQFLVRTGTTDAPLEAVQKLTDRYKANLAREDSVFKKLPGKYSDESLQIMAEDTLARAKRVSPGKTPSAELSEAERLYNAVNGEGLSMDDINKLKQQYERTNKVDYFKANDSEKAAYAKELEGRVRDFQRKQAEVLGYENLADVKKDTQLSRFLADEIFKKEAGASANNITSITDYIMLSGASPEALAGFAAKKVFSSPKIQAWVAKKLAPTEGSLVVPKVGETKFKRLPAPSGKKPVTVITPETITLPESAARTNLGVNEVQSLRKANTPTTKTNNSTKTIPKSVTPRTKRATK